MVFAKKNYFEGILVENLVLHLLWQWKPLQLVKEEQKGWSQEIGLTLPRTYHLTFFPSDFPALHVYPLPNIHF